MSRAAPKDSVRTQLLQRGRWRRAAHRNSNIPALDEPVRDFVPDLELRHVATDSLKAPARKTRKASQAHVSEVAASIRRLGFCAPILIGDDDQVIDGVVRLEAARRLAHATVPVLRVGHLSRAEQRALRIAINRLGEKGEWDIVELRLELQELTVEVAPIEILGFSSAEIDDITAPEQIAGPEQGPLAPPSKAVAVARCDDLFALGQHRLLCGDSTVPNAFAGFGADRLATLVLTDEPYNVRVRGNVTGGDHREFAMASGEMTATQFAAFNRAWIGAALPNLVNGGILATFIDWRGLPSVQGAAEALGLSNLNLIVWAKTNAGMGSFYRSQHELLPLFKKGAADHINNINLGKAGRHRSNVWTHPGASSLGSDARKGLREHPTVKPVALLSDAILDMTNRGDLVLDPFLGSGSTLMAAEASARVCHAIEIDPLYVDVALRRFKAKTGVDPVLVETGETFDALAARRAAEAKPAVTP